MTEDLRELLETAVRAARTGARMALHYFHEGVTARRKPDGSPVTDADVAVEEAVRRVLEEAAPGVPVLGEELGGGDPRGPDGGDRWIVDPIDGTRNFLRRIPIFATLVAFESNGVCLVGAAEAPGLEESLGAAHGLGCFRNGEPARVSDVKELETALVVTGGLEGLLGSAHRERFLDLMRRTERQRGFGDFYGHLLVATGRAEIMLETGIHPWDVAPWKVIVEEAGGRLTSLDGIDSIYRGSALATNGSLHEAVLTTFQGSREAS